jgi:hypothetical protein
MVIAMAVSFAAVVPAAAEPIPGTSCSMFPSDNVFNTDIWSLPVDPRSGTWMGNMTQNANLHPDLGTFAQGYGIPINVAPPPTTGVTPTFGTNTESDYPTEGYPIDQSTLIEGGPTAPSGSDRHALVVNKNVCKLYEIYNLQNFTNGQTPQAGSGAVWDLSSNTMRPNGWTSADAAGFPIAPLLLRPDEILAGSIAHAIRFTTHCTNGYIWPASHNAGLCNTSFPPMGARFRLRSTFDISHFSATTQVVLRAFQHYGLLLADNGSDWYFQGSTDDWWGTTAGSAVVGELKTIPAAQFDAIDESSLQVATGSYRAVAPPPNVSGGGILTSGPAAAAGAAGSVDVFARGADGALWQTHWNGSAFIPGFTSLGGLLTGDPGAVANGTSRTDVFVRGGDNQLYQKTWNGITWGPWRAIGGILTSGPEASPRAGSVLHIDLWVSGSDHQLYHRWSDDGGNTFGGWQAMGGVLTSDPGAVSWSSNRADVFIRGADFQLWHKYWDVSAGSGGWEALGGYLTSSPGVASCQPGHLDVFVRGSDNAIWRKGWNGTAWTGWARVGGTWRSSPAAVCLPGTNNIGLFVRGTDDALWMLTTTAS